MKPDFRLIALDETQYWKKWRTARVDADAIRFANWREDSREEVWEAAREEVQTRARL